MIDPIKNRKKVSKHYHSMSVEQKMRKAAKGRATRKGLEFDISAADIMIPKCCPVLGIPLRTSRGIGKHTANSPSLDRIDPTRGYVKDNIWVISMRANTLKNDASLDELKRLVAALEDL